MPAPIVKIPVDDAAFKRFLDTFQKYQKELATQPEMWKGMNDGMSSAAIAGAAIAAEIAHQAEATKDLAEAESKRDKAMQKAADDAAKEAEKAKKRDEDAAKRRKDAIDHVKNYTKSLAEAALQMGKWAVIGGGMELGAAALAGFGMKDLAGWAGDARKSAMGLGVSVGQQQRANLTLGRYISPDAALEKIANAQGTSEGISTFAKMGINPAGKDPSQLLYEAAEKAAGFMNRFKGSPAQLTIAQQQGYGDFFEPDELRALAAAQANKNELHQTITKGNATWATLGINDQTGQKWQDFSATIDAVGLKLKDHLADKLIVLAPNLEKVTDAFGTLIDTVLTKTNLDALTEGIGDFAKYIGSQTFKDDMATFAGGISAVANMMRKVFKHSDLVKGIAEAGAGAYAGGLVGGPAGAVVGGVLGAADAYGSSTAGQGGTQFQGVNQSIYQTIGRYWMSQGYTEEGARGMMTNMVAENALFNPFKPGDNGKSYGLFQESAKRRAGYNKHFHHTMESVTNRAQAIAEQLEWYKIEAEHIQLPQGGTLAQYMKSTHDAGKAGYYDSLYGEGAGGANPRNPALEANIRGTGAAHNAPRIKVDVALNVQPGTSAPHIANAVGYA